jgi:hypothetical protein
MRIFTATEKFDCIQREIKMRRRVYPRWVADGRMTQEKASAEIACMEAIAADYEQQAQGERLL